MAAQKHWSWEIRGFHLTDTTGDSEVTFYGMELGAGLRFDRWRFDLVVPAITIDGPGTLTGLGPGVRTWVGPGREGSQGESGQGSQQGTGPTGSGGGTGSGSGSGGQPLPASAPDAGDTVDLVDVGSRSGIGDVRLAFRRWLGANRSWGRMSVLGGVKLPTADETKGLGTGQTDGWLGLGWYRQGWTVDLSAFVEWVELGQTDAYELTSGPAGGFYADWPLRAVGIEAGLEAAASPVPGSETRAWAVAAVRGGAGNKLVWRLETFYGLNETSTDLGVTLTLTPRLGR